MDIGGWKTSSMFHRYAIVNNDDKRTRPRRLNLNRPRTASLGRFPLLRAAAPASAHTWLPPEHYRCGEEKSGARDRCGEEK
jgi:hypothetical protein